MIARLLLFAIRVYWWTLSPLIGRVCRFEPSCSRYTATCIDRFGAARGTYLGVLRICRCHPFHPGGYDPPPPPDAFRPSTAPPTETSANGVHRALPSSNLGGATVALASRSRPRANARPDI